MPSDSKDLDRLIAAATALHSAGRPRDAERVLLDGLAADPHCVVLNNACGVMLAAQGRHAEAARRYRVALRGNPEQPAIWTNLGNALTHLKLCDSAIACHDAALLRAPEDGGLHYNRGISLAEAGRHSEAVIAFTAALRHAPQHGMAAWDRARSLLYMGNYAAGWADYEIRLQNGLVPARQVPGVRWRGSTYQGRRLLLLAEQGFGDMIWVSRYLPMVKALGGELVVECHAELVGLYTSLGIADRVITQGTPLPPADLHAWHCSLPGLFASQTDQPPPPVPPPVLPDRSARLRPVFAPAGDVLRVGIVWSGSTGFARNAERAQPLSAFLEAFDQPGVQLYSLQKGPPEAELHGLEPGRVIDLAPSLHGFDDTAAAIAALDLVIMTDSAVAHLAGAMHRPVWVLLGRNPHWLWLHDRSDNPWYPSMRLFRPRGDADWHHVFDQAGTAMMRLRGERP